MTRPPCCPDCRSPMVFIDEDMSGQGGPPGLTWLCSNKTCGRCLGSYVFETQDHDHLSTSNLVDVLARLIHENRLQELHREDTLGVLMKAGAFRTFRPKKGPPYGAVFRGSVGDPDDPLVHLATLIDDRLAALTTRRP